MLLVTDLSTRYIHEMVMLSAATSDCGGGIFMVTRSRCHYPSFGSKCLDSKILEDFTSD